jgi:hypothetical protein
MRQIRKKLTFHFQWLALLSVKSCCNYETTMKMLTLLTIIKNNSKIRNLTISQAYDYAAGWISFQIICEDLVILTMMAKMLTSNHKNLLLYRKKQCSFLVFKCDDDYYCLDLLEKWMGTTTVASVRTLGYSDHLFNCPSCVKPSLRS